VTSVAQIMAEVGRLHMENLELKSAIVTRDERIKELEAVAEGRRQEPTVAELLKPAPRGRRKQTE
jgi:hypothetical protein